MLISRCPLDEHWSHMRIPLCLSAFPFLFSKWPFPIFFKKRKMLLLVILSLIKISRQESKRQFKVLVLAEQVNYSKDRTTDLFANQMLSHHFNKGEGETNEHLVIHMIND